MSLKKVGNRDMNIKVDDLQKSFGAFVAVKSVSFEIDKGKLIGLLGPSGSGKSTILRMLAGLEEPDFGEIWFDGRNVNQVTPQERGIGLVFQNYALFRHMTVFENIAFGLKVLKRKHSEIKIRVNELIELTGLHGLGNRLPGQLSGGQRQRVAFARALAPEPQLLLLDEPFAAIDAKVRKELRSWLKDMINRLGITTIFVTHDQEEAVEVADEIMILHKGRLEQKGTPIEIYKEPQSPFVAGFIGESSRIDSIDYLRGFEEAPKLAQAIIRPEFLEIGRPHEIIHPSAAERGVVNNVFFRGTFWHIEVEVGNYRMFGCRSLEKEELSPGDQVLVLIHRLYAFNGEETVMVENGLKIDPFPVHILGKAR